MELKPKNKSGYTPEDLERAQMTCLVLAVKLQAFIEEIVVVGGLVPSLIVDQTGAPRHGGTLDTDIGIAAHVRDDERYRTFEEALRNGGFVPAVKPNGRQQRQTWRLEGTPLKLTVDFLMEAPGKVTEKAELINLTKDLAPIASSALDCAFADKLVVSLDGTLPSGSKAKRDIQVCGPGAFTVLKALSMRGRDASKDAYDLDYVLHHWAGGRFDIAARIAAFTNKKDVEKALLILAQDFESAGHRGPESVAEFELAPDNFDLRADVAGRVRELLSYLPPTK